MTEMCLNCRCWVPADRLKCTLEVSGKAEPAGHCRRYPPRIVPPGGDAESETLFNIEENGAGGMADSGGSLGTHWAIGVWPIVAPDDWCGEYQSDLVRSSGRLVQVAVILRACQARIDAAGPDNPLYDLDYDLGRALNMLEGAPSGTD